MFIVVDYASESGNLWSSCVAQGIWPGIGDDKTAFSGGIISARQTGQLDWELIQFT